MPNRPAGALLDGCDMSQHIHDGAALAAFRVPGGGPIEFVVRYTSVNTPGVPQKQVTSADVATCRANRLSLVLVHEEGAQAALGTYADGAADAAQALAVARSFGMPPDTVIHCAIDFDASGPDVAAYVRGFGDKMGRGRRAAYGGRKPLRYLLDHDLIDYAWQTYAWSIVNGSVDWTAGITAAQWRNDVSAAGNTVDLDSAMALDYGQLGPDWTSTDRGIDMTTVDLTPAAIEAVRKAIMGSRIDNVAPPASGAPVSLEQAERMAYYRIAYLALNAAPAEAAQLAAILAQSQANGGGISAIQSTLAGFSSGATAAGATPAQIAAAYRAAADELDPAAPPATPPTS